MIWLRVILERILSLDPTVRQQITGDHLGNDGAGPVAFLGDVGSRMRSITISIVAAQWTAEGEGHEPLGQVAGQVPFPLGEEGLQFCRRGEILAVWQLSCGVDVESLVVFFPPPSDGIEIFQSRSRSDRVPCDSCGRSLPIGVARCAGAKSNLRSPCVPAPPIPGCRAEAMVRVPQEPAPAPKPRVVQGLSGWGRR